jgi:hypothetical protein
MCVRTKRLSIQVVTGRSSTVFELISTKYSSTRTSEFLEILLCLLRAYLTCLLHLSDTKHSYIFEDNLENRPVMFELRRVPELTHTVRMERDPKRHVLNQEYWAITRSICKNYPDMICDRCQRKEDRKESIARTQIGMTET